MPYTPNTPNPNILFTDNQIAYLASAYANTASVFPGNDGSFNDDNANLNTGANNFASDMSGQGFDRGRYNFAWPNNSRIPEFPEDGIAFGAMGPYEPFFNVFPCGPSENCNRNIHGASIKALALSDQALALQVLEALRQLATDDTLDFSNGGLHRNTGAGEPARNNPTFGQTRRYERDYGGIYSGGQYTTNGNPFFIKASKMEQYLLSYGNILDLVDGTPQYTAARETINYWFKDAHDFFLARFSIKQNDWFGSNWRTFSGYPTASRSTSGGAVLRNSSGTVLYTVLNATLQGLNNRALDIASFLKAYATMYGLDTTEDYVYDYFRLVIYLGVLPDGTYTEFYRGDPGPDYAFTAITHLVLMAHLNEVAVLRGYLPAGDAGKYYNFTSSTGSDEIYSSASATSTSGGPKGLALCLERLAQMWRDPSVNGGQRGTFNTGGSSNNPLNHDLRASLPIAIANAYYQRADFEDFWRFRTSAGYQGPNPNGSANGAAPHTLGISWDMGAAAGGLGPYSINNAFAGSPPDPDPDPDQLTTSKKINYVRRR